MKRHEPGDYRTRDGQGRVVRINESGDEQWQAQVMVPGGFWSWVTTTKTKAEALETLRAERQFIW